MSPTDGDQWRLKSDLPGSSFGSLDRLFPKKLQMTTQLGLRIPVQALEVENSYGGLNAKESVLAVEPGDLPSVGARTSKFRFLNTQYGDHRLVLTVEGLAGTTGIVTLIPHGHFVPRVQTIPEAGIASDSQTASISFRGCDADPFACTTLPLVLSFPPGEGWKTIVVTLTW